MRVGTSWMGRSCSSEAIRVAASESTCRLRSGASERSSASIGLACSQSSRSSVSLPRPASDAIRLEQSQSRRSEGQPSRPPSRAIRFSWSCNES
eukprot:1723757-Prymnesium_polylepis.1